MAAPTLADLTDWRTARELGTGASATVRLVGTRASSPVQQFALKVVDKAKIVGQQQLTRLYREKDLLTAISHPFIVTLHATLKDETHLYFLLDLLPGGELLWHMRQDRRSRVPALDAKITLGTLLLPLQHLHSMGIMYRDLKPTNILFTAAGRLTLVDLGHAKRIDGPIDEERSTSICGTPHYHAPETVRGDGHGFPAQLWALGVLLVEMISGRPPFWEGGGFPPLREQIAKADPDLIPLPEDAKPLAQDLLLADPRPRRAAFPGNGYDGVRSHSWFSDLNWAGIEDGTVVPNFSFARACAETMGVEDDDKANAHGTDDMASLTEVFKDF